MELSHHINTLLSSVIYPQSCASPVLPGIRWTESKRVNPWDVSFYNLSNDSNCNCLSGKSTCCKQVGSKIIQNQTKPDTSPKSLCSRQEERENQVFSPAKHCRYKTPTQMLQRLHVTDWEISNPQKLWAKLSPYQRVKKTLNKDPARQEYCSLLFCLLLPSLPSPAVSSLVLWALQGTTHLTSFVPWTEFHLCKSRLHTSEDTETEHFAPWRQNFLFSGKGTTRSQDNLVTRLCSV